MTHLRTFITLFIVLSTVFLVHTDSNLWIRYPERMVMKEKATTVEHVLWSTLLAGLYSILGLGISTGIGRLWGPRQNRGTDAAPPPSPNGASQDSPGHRPGEIDIKGNHQP